jgi:thiamine biosynthesis lipoprotein
VPERPDPRLPAWIVGARAPQRGVWSVLARKAWLADALTKVAALTAAGERERVLERFGARLVPAGDA